MESGWSVDGVWTECGRSVDGAEYYYLPPR